MKQIKNRVKLQSEGIPPNKYRVRLDEQGIPEIRACLRWRGTSFENITLVGALPYIEEHQHNF
jgi:hypothetical protein